MKILALIDNSMYSVSVCDYAGWFGARAGASVDLVHVLPDGHATSSNLSGTIGLGARSNILTELAELDAQKARVIQKQGRAVIEDARARVLSEHPELELHGKLRHGDLVETVADLEPDASLIVIGKRGEDAHAARGHLGSNLERIVRASHKPVLVVNRSFHPVQHPLVAFDGGPSTRKAIEHLRQSRVFAGMRVTLLSVGTVQGIDEAGATLTEAGYEVSVDARQGDVETQIEDALKSGEHDLLIMGAYGHSRIRNLLIGSTTSQMIQISGIPLLLFR